MKKIKLRVINNSNGHDYPFGSTLILSQAEYDAIRLRGAWSGLEIDPDDPNRGGYGRSRQWRGNTIRYTDLKLIEEEEVSVSGIIKKKTRQVHAPDKYKDNMVINLNKDKSTIYLSTALRDMLLHQSNRVGFAFDNEKNAHYIYCEMEEKEGYDVNTDGTITSTAEWKDLQSIFNKNELYVNSAVIKDIDNPDYIFYQIVDSKVVKKAVRKTTMSNAINYGHKLSSYFETGTIGGSKIYTPFDDTFLKPAEEHSAVKEVVDLSEVTDSIFNKIELHHGNVKMIEDIQKHVESKNLATKPLTPEEVDINTISQKEFMNQAVKSPYYDKAEVYIKDPAKAESSYIRKARLSMLDEMKLQQEQYMQSMYKSWGNKVSFDPIMDNKTENKIESESDGTQQTEQPSF